MNMLLPRFILVICAAALFTAASAHAHKIRVFAYESGGTIYTEVKFSSSRPAQHIQILVEDGDGSLLLSGNTDENGQFQFAVPPGARIQKQDLKIIADVGEGHRGYWLLEAADYLAAATPQEEVPQPGPPAPAPEDTPEKYHKKAADQGLEERIEEIVRQELLPVKRMLAQEREKKLSLQDILGGLGYIFGLAGIAAYCKSKRKGDK